jgi:hypothetical protein
LQDAVAAEKNLDKVKQHQKQQPSILPVKSAVLASILSPTITPINHDPSKTH